MEKSRFDPFEITTRFNLHPLPAVAAAALRTAGAQPRLMAHLVLVHAVAVQIVTALQQRFPALVLDTAALLFGAAIHDIGKVVHPEELTGPGNQHENAGYLLLVRQGVAPELARFARTHAGWREQPDLALEDLLVALADTCWKGQRDQELETRIIAQIIAAGDSDSWDVFLFFDNLIEQVSADAETRLMVQAAFAVA